MGGRHPPRNERPVFGGLEGDFLSRTGLEMCIEERMTWWQVHLDLLLCVDFKMTAGAWVGAVVWKTLRADLRRAAILKGKWALSIPPWRPGDAETFFPNYYLIFVFDYFSGFSTSIMLPYSLHTPPPPCPGSFQHAMIQDLGKHVLSPKSYRSSFPTAFFILQTSGGRVVQKGLREPEPGEGTVLEIGRAHMLRSSDPMAIHWVPMTSKHSVFLPRALCFHCMLYYVDQKSAFSLV